MSAAAATKLRKAAADGQTAGKEGVDVTECPYPAGAERDLWLDWWVHERLNHAGWPQ